MRDYHNISIETLFTNIPLFSGLSPDEIKKISKGAKELHYEKGEIVCHHGDPCNGFYVVIHGQVKLSINSTKGVEKIVAMVSQGQSFGEAIMFLEKPYPVSAEALADTALLHISRSVIFEELERSNYFVKKILGGLSMQTHQLLMDIEDYSLHSGTQRVIGYLIQVISSGNHGKENISITLPYNKGVIASRLNLTQEHFSRILHDMVAINIVRVDGRVIHIPSLELLVQHLNN